MGTKNGAQICLSSHMTVAMSLCHSNLCGPCLVGVVVRLIQGAAGGPFQACCLGSIP